MFWISFGRRVMSFVQIFEADFAFFPEIYQNGLT